MSNSLQNAFLKTAEENSGSGSHCVSGCMYQVVQTIGTDGKNLLQLLPITKSSGNLTPVVQSPVVSDTLKGDTGKPVQVTFQTQISSSSTSASVQLPIFQPANTTKYFFTGTVDTSGKGRVTSVGTGSFTPPVSKVESHGVKIDGLTMQTFAIPPSTQNDSSYFVVNTPSFPVNVNSSVLPSGHHLQIPAHAEVNSTPASTFSPSVQQKTLATAAASTSGTVEPSQIPTVIFVSPVNSVKNRVTKNFQNIYPKPTISNTMKIPPNIATETQLRGYQHSQAARMKWNFQESLQPGIPSFVPVKSSNNVASKILKTCIGRKRMRDNNVNTPLLNTFGSNGTQPINVPIKDNALVMFNGKVCLLTKRGPCGLPSQNDQQNSVFSDISLRKDSSQVVSSSPGTETSKEVYSALIKSKSLQLETKSLSDTQLASMTNLKAVKKEKVERSSFSMTNLHTMNQSNIYLKQSKTLFTNPVFPDGFRTGQNAPRKGNLIQSIEKIRSSVDATTVTSQQCVFRDQEVQTQYEMASVLKKDSQERNNKKYSQGSNTKASYVKSDAEFKRLFGLTKDLRVCLTRIPDHLVSRKDFDSFSSSMKSSSYKDADSVVKEEEIKQSFPKKRKAKTVKKMDYTKRRKIKRASNTVMNGMDVNSSQLLSILPASDIPQQNIVTSHSTTKEDKITEVEEHCSPDKQEKGTLSSSTSFEPSNYFNKNYTEDIFLVTPPELEETIRDEKIRRLKQILQEKEAALEEMRKMHQKK
ncbi:ligand-dependent nuclear receptor-interacting factor 1 isoform X1 [Onychomys torridus]|uniref:ligand-dependent nuclear receptor-interacting factor 1 isoform X1 n=2 Tax=Onychomys torridus TaxID=38674 RepID=UPI00167F64FC|nr:ligand-dependent nuclear receptor-interacting factor 1 isoform X1 [Onychomys torridus]